MVCNDDRDIETTEEHSETLHESAQVIGRYPSLDDNVDHSDAPRVWQKPTHLEAVLQTSIENDVLSSADLHGDREVDVDVSVDLFDTIDDAFDAMEQGPWIAVENEDACFGVGTLIAVPGGESAIESLASGDEVLTASGSASPIKWVGKRHFQNTLTVDDRACPVRISAGALAAGVPHTDLIVLPDHGIILGNIITNAGALLNGTTIARRSASPSSDGETFYHIELHEHEVILANGAHAETYFDMGGRRLFENFAQYADEFGNGPGDAAELTYPRVLSRRQLPKMLRRLLAEREAALADESS